jgi:Fe-S cluster assembly protein SufB
MATPVRPELKSEYEYGFRDPDMSIFRSGMGLSRAVVEEISGMKGEPDWMLEFRLKALEIFEGKPVPTWGGDLSPLDFQKIVYYVKPSERAEKTWDDVPDQIKNTFERLGIPEAERKFLAGVSAQYESEVVYHHMQESLEKQGVLFSDMDSGLREHPDIVKRFFGTIIPPSDNKFAALNSAVWSGGSFIYVPPGIKLEIPLQAYFRINTENMGQFERTLIIADEGASVHYVEGCTAPIYSTDSLHAAVVELIALKGGHIRYTTLQNWAPNIYNLVTKRAFAYEDATVEWIDGNMGSKLTMKYPSIYLLGPRARANILSIAVAGKGQHQDAGGKVIHAAPDTESTVLSKSISHDGGKTTYRGLLQFSSGAARSKSSVRCDALLFDPQSVSETVPDNRVMNDDITLEHEATVSKVSEEQLFYLMSRGLSQAQAAELVVMGFIEPFTKELPMEYALEMNRLIRWEMDGGVG